MGLGVKYPDEVWIVVNGRNKIIRVFAEEDAFKTWWDRHFNDYDHWEKHNLIYYTQS